MCVHTLGRHAAAAPAALGLPTHPGPERGGPGARAQAEGAPRQLRDGGDLRPLLFKPVSPVLSARERGEWGARRVGRRRGGAAPGGAHQRPPRNWCAFPPINGVSCPLPLPPRPPRRPGSPGAGTSLPPGARVPAGASGRPGPFQTGLRAGAQAGPQLLSSGTSSAGRAHLQASVLVWTGGCLRRPPFPRLPRPKLPPAPRISVALGAQAGGG